MDWHYVKGKERRGPFPEAEVRTLIGSGRITADTRVWTPGMAEWKPAGTTPLFGAPAPAPELQCIITGKIFPEAQMIKTGHGWVSVEGKDIYYQCLREGVPLPTPGNMNNARADKKRIVVPVANPSLPARCVKTNEPCTYPQTKRRTLYHYPPLLALTILLSVIVFLILYLIVRKKVELEIPLCKRGRSLVTRNALITWVLELAGIAGMFSALSYGPIAFLFGLVVVIGGLIFGSLKASTLRVVKLRGGYAWLSGACPEYLASLPPYS